MIDVDTQYMFQQKNGKWLVRAGAAGKHKGEPSPPSLGTFPLAEAIRVRDAYRNGQQIVADPSTRAFQKFRSDYDDPGPAPGTPRFVKHDEKWQKNAGRHYRLQQVLRALGMLKPGGEVKIKTDSDSVIIGKAGIMYLAREVTGEHVGPIFCERISPEAKSLIEDKFGIEVILVCLEDLEAEAA